MSEKKCFCSGGFASGGYVREPIKATGEVEAILSRPESFVSADLISDPLQDAITSTEIACRTAQDLTLLLLQEHLSRLLKLQRKQFKEG